MASCPGEVLFRSNFRTFCLSHPSLRILSNFDLSEMIPAQIIISDRAVFWVLVAVASKRLDFGHNPGIFIILRTIFTCGSQPEVNARDTLLDALTSKNLFLHVDDTPAFKTTCLKS